MIDADQFVIDNLSFYKEKESKLNNGFIGFFDWLRADLTTIVGIRMCFFSHHKYLSILQSFEYTQVKSENNCCELLFDDSEYFSEISDDQDSTNNFVFESIDKKEYLFTFGLDGLSESELNGLIAKCQKVPKENLLE
ncbi:hypothetical protein [Chitinophaga sp.]|uniref:hypothetical protein n=1 Tax=Chitinophaga sp. TaxID=1869181 RepID=UPI0031D6C8E2